MFQIIYTYTIALRSSVSPIGEIYTFLWDSTPSYRTKGKINLVAAIVGVKQRKSAVCEVGDFFSLFSAQIVLNYSFLNYIIAYLITLSFPKFVWLSFFSE